MEDSWEFSNFSYQWVVNNRDTIPAEGIQVGGPDPLHNVIQDSVGEISREKGVK